MIVYILHSKFMLIWCHLCFSWAKSFGKERFLRLQIYRQHWEQSQRP